MILLPFPICVKQSAMVDLFKSRSISCFSADVCSREMSPRSSGCLDSEQMYKIFLACELSVFQDQIPITLKSLAQPSLPSGSLDLDTVKKTQRLTKGKQKSHSKSPTSCKTVEKGKSAVLS